MLVYLFLWGNVRLWVRTYCNFKARLFVFEWSLVDRYYCCFSVSEEELL